MIKNQGTEGTFAPRLDKTPVWLLWMESEHGSALPIEAAGPFRNLRRAPEAALPPDDFIFYASAARVKLRVASSAHAARSFGQFPFSSLPAVTKRRWASSVYGPVYYRTAAANTRHVILQVPSSLRSLQILSHYYTIFCFVPAPVPNKDSSVLKCGSEPCRGRQTTAALTC